MPAGMSTAARINNFAKIVWLGESGNSADDKSDSSVEHGPILWPY